MANAIFVAGIDFGSSMTDCVIIDSASKKIIAKKSFESINPNISKIAKFVKKYSVEKIAITGSGAKKSVSYLKKINLKPAHIDEISAIGKAGSFISKEKSLLVVSVGSGTAMVSSNSGKYKHIGGTSIGAGTLIGLSRLLTGASDLKKIEKLSKKGNLEKIDMTLRSIYPKGIGILPPTATASSFGNLKNPNDNDKAKALLNMIAQSIGTLSVFAAKASGHRKIILLGRIVSENSFKKIILSRINTLSDIPVMIPKDAEIATALGAALLA